MAIRKVMERGEGFLKFIASGEWDFPDAVAALQSARDESERSNLMPVLINMSMVTGTPETMQRVDLGLLIAEQLRRVKLAVVARPEIITRLAETVALNRRPDASVQRRSRGSGMAPR